MAFGNTIEQFPRQTPDSDIIVEDEAHEFVVLEYDDSTTSTQYTYVLDKAPVKDVRSVTGQYNGSTVEFTKGTDYQVIDDDADGDVDTIDWDVGGRQPDDNTEFEATYVCEPIISRYLESHDAEVDTTDAFINSAIVSHQVDKASGKNLNRIGALFGELGKRRGRSDPEYRTFLKSIVQSFSGRGTVPGLKFAIAAGVGTDPENVTISEDFTEVGYSIQIEGVDTSFLTGVISDLADLADPSGVELLAPPVVVLPAGEIEFETPGSQVVSSTEGLGSGTLTLDGDSQLQ
jgi:hypothetical protein